MIPSATSSLHLKVVVTVSSLILMIVIYSAWSISSSSRMVLQAGERQATGYAKALSEHVERAFSEADGVLTDTIEDIKATAEKPHFDPLDMHLALKRHAEGVPQIGSLILVDGNGNLKVNSLSDGQLNINVADRDYFRFHKENPGKGLFISRPFKSRVVDKWRFTLSRPLLDSRGNFAGLVAVAFNIEYFQRFYSSINVGREGRIVLVHRDNPVLVMEPFSEKAMTLDYSNSILFREKLPSSKSGIFQIEKGIVVNSPPRIISYVTLSRFPIIALVSLSRDEIMMPWKSSAVMHGISTIILCLALIALAALHLRQLRRLEDANMVLVAQQGELISGEKQRRHMEEQLIQAQKMESVGQLAGGVAHDFNNLLTPIIGYAEMLRGSVPAASEERVKIDVILGAATRAKDLTKQLLGFARKQVMSMNLIDLNESVSAFNSILRRVVRESIDLRVNLEPRPMLICADQSQLEHVLLNLVVNAQDAIKGNGEITVSISHLSVDGIEEAPVPVLPVGRYVVMSVSDTGCGIESEHLDHIFEPFFTTKTAGHGTGLGLAMVYGIIKQHNGFISVKSSPGKGSVFTLWLPEAEGHIQCHVAEMPGEILQPEPAHLLVVEDNEMVRDMVVHILNAEGHQVTSAESAAQALKLIDEAETPFDLLVSDVIMPQMNGPAMYAKMLETSHELKAIFISGYSNDPVLMSAVDAESVHFLQKPFSVDDLVGKVRESLSA